jgi:hypothetical protein
MEKDQPLTTFAIEWGAYAYQRIPFFLDNTPTCFSNTIIEIFKNFIPNSFEVY